MNHISSTQNNVIKELISLQSKAKKRTEKQQFVVEGRRELHIASVSDYTINALFWCPEIFKESDFLTWVLQFDKSINLTSVSLTVYQKLVVRENTEGIIGVLSHKNHSLDSWQPKSKNPIIVVLESIEKPGNLGAILRTGDASGIDSIIITEQRTDIYNPNVIRSSVGAFFSVPIFVCSNKEAYDFLIKNNINTYAASLQNSIDYGHLDYRQPTAFVMGSEAKGLSPFWYKHGITAINIPMFGNVDSLNVSVATAILTYEVIRQRSS